jgi:uncharacterized protein YpmB
MNSKKSLVIAIILTILLLSIYLAVFQTSVLYYQFLRLSNGSVITINGNSLPLSDNFAILNSDDNSYVLLEKSTRPSEGGVYITDAKTFLDSAGLSGDSLVNNCQHFQLKKEHELSKNDPKTYLVKDKRILIIVNNVLQGRKNSFYCNNIFN